ncbi:MAG: peptide chain release factor N(5)-glutamine methyltransferase [Cyanobacteria bacterium P01_H01_bin.153]
MMQFPHTLSGQEIWQWRSRAFTEARASQIDLAEVDWLLRGLCQIEPLTLRLGTLALMAAIPSHVTRVELAALWERRVRDRVPIQQLVGQMPWRDLTLRVSPAVLIPRPETELIIDIAASWVAQSPQAAVLRQSTWVDLGTGSGAIALGLARTFPEAEILAVDVSEAALAIAQQNAVENSLGDRVQFFQGSWLEPLSQWRGTLAGLISNPPYIPKAIVPTLAPEVANHEPHLALDGGDDGLDAIRYLVQAAPDYLQPGGLWLVEHMQGQSPAITALLAATNQFEQSQSVQDLAGSDRFVQAQTITSQRANSCQHPKLDQLCR